MRFAFPLVAFLLLSCAPQLSLGTACDLSSDCDATLVCRHQRCRVACREARDCGPGLRCVIDDEGSSCTLEVEETCSTDDPCPGALRCRSGQCRTECDAVRMCTSRGTCVDGSCVEERSGDDAGMPLDAGVDAGVDANCSPTPMVCGNGTLETCEAAYFEPITRIMTMGAQGEIERLGPVWLDGVPIPRDEMEAAVRPELALGLSSAGFGVVAQIAGGTRRLSLSRIELPTLRVGAFAGADAIEGVRSMGLTETGDRVTGFVLLSPTVPRETSGLRLVLGPTVVPDPIGAGDPVAGTSGRLAIAGGTSSVLGETSPLFYVLREAPVGGLVVGAVDDDLSADTFRSAVTTDLTTSRYLETSGSAGSVVLLHGPGEPDVGLWRITRTLAGSRAGTLEILDVAGVGDPALELVTAGGVDYLIATPSMEGPDGVTRFTPIRCAATGPAPCGMRMPVPFPIPTRSARNAAAVRLARLPAGYALAELSPAPGDADAIYLRFLNDEVVESDPADGSGLPALLSEMSLPPGAQIMTLVVRAVRSATDVTIVVAALVRDTSLDTDAIWLAGYRACAAR